MLLLSCVLVSLLVCTAQSQGICHSNHQQLSEDEVIHNVVQEMDEDGDGVIQLWETYYFFAEILGRMTPEISQRLRTVTEAELQQLIYDYLSDHTATINKQQFSQAWHNRFHDSMPFIESVYDNFIDHNDNGLFDADELIKLRDDALNHYDANHDHSLQLSEMETFLESIYHNPDCVDVVGR